MKLQHCWHPLEMGTQDYFRGGSEEHKCCWCDLTLPIMVSFEYTNLGSQHGPHFKTRHLVRHWPDMGCPERARLAQTSSPGQDSGNRSLEEDGIDASA